jgi:hypothetical protein
MLAKYVAWDMPHERVKSLVKRALMPTPKGQWYLAVWTAHGALFTNYLATEDFDNALNSGLEYTRTQLVAADVLEQSEEPPTTIEYGNFDFEELGIKLRDKWIELVPSQVFEPLLMTLASTDPPCQIDFNRWHDVLVKNFGSHNSIVSGLEWMEIGTRASQGNADAIAKAKDTAMTASVTAPAAQRLAHVICCASKFLPIKECISAQYSFLISIPIRLENTVYAQAFTRLVAKRWIYLAEKQKFMLGSPAFYAPRIRDTASRTVLSISECASLLLMIAEAARFTWPQEMLDSLSALSRTSA